MSVKRIISIICAAVFFAVFAYYTYAVMTIDVQPVGPGESLVGLATFNMNVRQGFGIDEIWYTITKVIGWLAIFVCMVFWYIGAKQLFFTRKSLKLVDRDIICLGILYSLCIIAYVVFAKVAITCRPVLEADGSLEASYPSSHTVLSVCVFVSLIIEIKRRVINKKKAIIESVICVAVTCICVVGRFLSGMHWATDIIGAMILSAALICVFLSILPGRAKRKPDKK